MVQSEETGDGEAAAGWGAQAVFDPGANAVERQRDGHGFEGTDTKADIFRLIESDAGVEGIGATVVVMVKHAAQQWAGCDG